ncbi:MAG: NAD(P)/FAD-dependent oxidoreductase [Bacillota bacterium]|nr:NAD(P)/FAD-dependent oxidoreductase [Bacillota bacterium]
MIRISNIRIDISSKNKDKIIEQQILTKLKIRNDELIKWKINKQSIDARRKNKITYQYSVDAEVKNEESILKRAKKGSVSKVLDKEYKIDNKNLRLKDKSPVIIGAGPAGLFCALVLAENNLKPIIIEQGKKVEERVKDIDTFWKTGELNIKSNVQFGEGGAGTFSDGKLTTLVRDKENRSLKVLQEFIEAGAPEEINYIKNPHIGTDNLRKVVINIRKKIENLGGRFYFQETFNDLVLEDDNIKKVLTDKREIETDHIVIAIGHSSRETFFMLNKYLQMTPKPFSIGLRIEHMREDIDFNQYGKMHNLLPSAEYKLVHHGNDRSTYTFCMCPGGHVIGASSEENSVVTNGMSNFKRNAENSNSAVLVNITPEDYYIDSPLDGIKFQQKWERKAFQLGGGDYKAPVQLFGDLENNRVSIKLGDIKPSYKPGYKFADLRECLPEYVIESLIEGINYFGNKIDNFNRFDAILTGVETRSSSPVRIDRDDEFQSNIKGLYPCGEGAGYAGGIMSSSMDGIKVAEQILKD